MEIFEYDFMRRAFVVGILLAGIIPSIGVIVVLKRLSMIGDALAHVSLAGVAAGLIMGINPILGSIIACIGAALSIEAIGKRIPKYNEISISIVMSCGVGLAGILSGFVTTSSNFNSFLFGSIVAISDFELYFVAVVGVVVILLFVLLYKQLFLVAFDKRFAKLAGVPVGAVNFAFTILTAVAISIAARTVGALMVSSLMVIPVACAMQVGKSYKQTVIFSIVFGQFFMVFGLMISYYASLRPGATVVLLGVLCLIFILIGKSIFKTERVR